MSFKGLLYLSLDVADVAVSKDFFAGTLGFALGNDESDKASFDFGQAYLIIRKGSGTGVPVEANVMPVIRVEDVEAYRTSLVEKGADVSQIVSGEWGFRQFEVRDPDGNRWAFGQPG